MKFRMPMGPGALVGLLLILGGTVLFIDNLNILPFSVTDAFWPLVLLVIGTLGFVRTQSLPVKVWSGAAIIAGTLLLLGAYQIIHVTEDIIWPLILIATGVIMLIYRLRWTEFTDRIKVGIHVGASSKSQVSDTKVHEVAVFSGIKRRVEASNFEGGDLYSMFGSIELDLRREPFSAAGRVVAVDANALFGGIEIRIPDTWRLSLQGTAIFGAYEDKTIPPRPEPGIETPTLMVSGGTIFGSVVVRN
jgi:predicted membrane protein